MWGCGPDTNTTSCGPQTVAAYNPGNWSATSTQASGNTAVLTYPNVQQVFTKTTNQDPAISAFASITSDLTETMNPQAGTDAEAAYDIWLSNTSGPNEIMIWVDNAGRGNGGARQIGTATIGGQGVTVYQDGGGGIIFSPDHNEQSGTGNILPTPKWLQGHPLPVRGSQDCGVATGLRGRGGPVARVVGGNGLRAAAGGVGVRAAPPHVVSDVGCVPVAVADRRVGVRAAVAAVRRAHARRPGRRPARRRTRGGRTRTQRSRLAGRAGARRRDRLPGLPLPLHRNRPHRARRR